MAASFQLQPQGFARVETYNLLMTLSDWSPGFGLLFKQCHWKYPQSPSLVYGMAHILHLSLASMNDKSIVYKGSSISLLSYFLDSAFS